MTDMQRETAGNVVLLHSAMRRRSVAQSTRPGHAPADPPAIAPDRVAAALAAAKMVQLMRDARDTVMPFRLFGEPAWELIVELFLGSADSLSVAVLCNACSCPERIAAQHLGKLIDTGLVIASPGWADDEDATAWLSPRGYRLAVDIFNVTPPPR